MKHSRILLTVCFLFALTCTVNAQEVVAPEVGSIDDIKSLRRVYVICEDGDERDMIVKLLGGYSGVEVVDSPKLADFYLEFKNLTRDAAATRSGGALAIKSQMRAFIVKPEDKTRVVAWTETETYEQSGGLVLGASNEINLTHHFINALQKARGEKKSSMRELFKHSKH